MSIAIRPAENADGPAVSVMVASILAEYGLKLDPAGIDADLNDLEANYHRPGGWFVVVEDEFNRLVGSAGLHPLDRETVELRKMYLRPEMRGFGLGKRLLDDAIQFARGAGYKKIVLETNHKLVQAIELYKARGFKEVTPEGCVSRCDQRWELAL